MSIERMDIHTLREMRGTRKEGLVLQGCGGDPGEWVVLCQDLVQVKMRN